MENKTINPKIRTACIAIFALVIVLSSATLIMQIPIQSANAKFYWDPVDDEYKYCDPGWVYNVYDDYCYLVD
jgi:hypothetical protein